MIIITGTGWDVRSPKILRDLYWMSLADRPTNQLKTLMFKTVNRQVPEYISEKFANTSSIHRHNLRVPQHNFFVLLMTSYENNYYSYY